jgi:hypothetical protein
MGANRTARSVGALFLGVWLILKRFGPSAIAARTAWAALA